MGKTLNRIADRIASSIIWAVLHFRFRDPSLMSETERCALVLALLLVTPKHRAPQ